MFMGDRGTDVASIIKSHRRYRGQWEQNRHSRDVAVCITNEHKTSQTCIYCFDQIRHPTARYSVSGKTAKRRVNGTLTGLNRQCILWQERRSCQTRDTVSAAAIALSSLDMTLFGEALPPFNPKISQSHTELTVKPLSSLDEAYSWAGRFATIEWVDKKVITFNTED